MDTKNKIQETRKITIIGIVVNIALSFVKLVLGIVGFSQAVVADAVHSLSDVSTDLAILFGVKHWTKPPDKDHPYGHDSIETLISFGIGGVLFSIAIGIAYNSIITFNQKDLSHPEWVAVIGAVLSIISKEILYRKTLRVGRKIHSNAIIANAWHHRSDALSSIPVTIAVVVAIIKPEWAFLDHVGAFIVSMCIIHAAWKIVKPVINEFIVTGLRQEDVAIMKTVALNTEGVKSVHALRTRKMGGGILVDMHVLVDKNISVEEGHSISEEVKSNLFKKTPNLLDVVVHLEPYTQKEKADE